MLPHSAGSLPANLTPRVIAIATMVPFRCDNCKEIVPFDNSPKSMRRVSLCWAEGTKLATSMCMAGFSVGKTICARPRFDADH